MKAAHYLLCPLKEGPHSHIRLEGVKTPWAQWASFDVAADSSLCGFCGWSIKSNSSSPVNQPINQSAFIQSAKSRPRASQSALHSDRENRQIPPERAQWPGKTPQRWETSSKPPRLWRSRVRDRQAGLSCGGEIRGFKWGWSVTPIFVIVTVCLWRGPISTNWLFPFLERVFLWLACKLTHQKHKQKFHNKCIEYGNDHNRVPISVCCFVSASSGASWPGCHCQVRTGSQLTFSG